MAVGKQLGEFSMKTTSITLEPGKRGSVSVSANFEGTATGDLECDVIATMTVDSRDGKDGEYRLSARCFLKDGEIVDANGYGKTTYNKIDHIWDVAGVAETADKRSWAVAGDINLATRSFSGKMFERN